MQDNKQPTSGSELRIDTLTLLVCLALRICGFHPQGPGSTPGLGNILYGSSVCWWNKLGFADLTLKSRVRLPDWETLESSTDFHYLEIDSMQQNKRPTSWSELGIDTWTLPVGLAVRICGFHPQGPGSTPGLETFWSGAVSVDEIN